MICVEEMPSFPVTINELVEENAEADHRYGLVVRRAKELARSGSVLGAARVTSGHPVERIVKFGADERCDLLVIGFMGHSSRYERIIGRHGRSPGSPGAARRFGGQVTAPLVDDSVRPSEAVITSLFLRDL